MEEREQKRFVSSNRWPSEQGAILIWRPQIFWFFYPLSHTEISWFCSFCLLFGDPSPTHCGLQISMAPKWSSTTWEPISFTGNWALGTGLDSTITPWARSSTTQQVDIAWFINRADRKSQVWRFWGVDLQICRRRRPAKKQFETLHVLSAKFMNFLVQGLSFFTNSVDAEFAFVKELED